MFRYKVLNPEINELGLFRTGLFQTVNKKITVLRQPLSLMDCNEISRVSLDGGVSLA
jgi:hypothetical protein